MVSLNINPELAAFLPVENVAKNEELEANILVYGILDPIKIWRGHDVIVDGHRRYAVATKHNLKFNIVELDFDDLPDVMQWMIENQDTRRNWTEHQRVYCLGAAMNARKQSHGGQRPKKDIEPTPEGESASDKTAKAIAASEGVSASTVKRAAVISANVDVVSSEHPMFKTAYLNCSFRISSKELEALVAMNKRDRAKVVRRLLDDKAKFDTYRKAVDDAFPPEPPHQSTEGEPVENGDEPAHDEDPVVEVRDSLGKVIVDPELQEIFSIADKFEDELKLMKAARVRIRKLVKTPAGDTVQFQELEASFTHLIGELEGRKPYTACQACNGTGKVKVEGKGRAKKCDACDGRAWIDKIHYDHLSSEQDKEVVNARSE